ncbi:TetR/AcrR family transcriptional regulator [Neorhizobium galegae]|uniref:TetR/AcrR family transcriptional regulator n=1 Tax=Neorhizobium galegae TaxID=399 RepID=UPI0006225723|nr:TetR/AcrR family transcriptional regulator [Neorhizobium galegae]CDZ57886.1 PhlF [Neorhizobium galegae bv. orientalis]KAB1122447.1 TetR/AcrR family transcriptional regulator [Neorhizobium galegae]MCQ1573833.1 TetR/AcrR family transcriptional regulator [Neorhizobium galegae]MCQ1805590.1 TetR/AcrR family transcriptional regulator [Neorhizobium galegae]MCQ1834807.1 TetR/AcrR family transcriptional regulator [Neorhizobium galegae]
MTAKKAAEARRTSIGAQRNPASQDAILQAAEEILVEGGLGSFSIEAVARRAHAGKPTIYRWWPTRTILLLDVYHRQKFVDIAPDTGAIETDIFQLLSDLLEFWNTGHGGAVFRSVIAEAQTDPAASKALAAYMAERYQQGGEIFRRAKARDEVADWVVPELAMEIITSFVWKRLLTDRLEIAPEQLRLVVRHLVHGLKVT